MISALNSVAHCHPWQTPPPQHSHSQHSHLYSPLNTNLLFKITHFTVCCASTRRHVTNKNLDSSLTAHLFSSCLHSVNRCLQIYLPLSLHAVSHSSHFIFMSAAGTCLSPWCPQALDTVYVNYVSYSRFIVCILSCPIEGLLYTLCKF